VVKEQGHSWQEFAAGYLMERAGFTDYVIELLADRALVCLKDPDSPWGRLKIVR
jgi:hypothetical protein